MRDSQNYPFGDKNGPKPIFGLQMGPIKVPRPVPGSIFHETDTRNLKKGVPGRFGTKFRDFGVGGSGAHFPRIWEFMPDPFFCVVPPLRRTRPAQMDPGGRPRLLPGPGAWALGWVNYSIHGPPTPQPQIPDFGAQRPRDPKHQIPRVRFMKNRPGDRSGDLNRTDLWPYVGLAHVCYSYPSERALRPGGEGGD